MYFDDIQQIESIAMGCGAAIFVLSSEIEIKIKDAIVLQPEEKTVITVEQIRSLMEKLSKKQFKDQFVIIRPADEMNHEAANAFLKSLEEPGERIHFVLITDKPSRLLPTILSRAVIYIWREKDDIFKKIKASDKDIEMAKKLIAAKPKELVGLTEEITRKKNAVRQHALDVLGAAIEILYKTYLINKKVVFLDKIPRFLKAYEAIEHNGHIKLHLVADLI